MTTQDYARIQTAKQLSAPRPPATRPSAASGSAASRSAASRSAASGSAETPAEAARQFEEVLVRQFVKVMTKGLFDTSLAGEGGPQWMQGQRDAQRDTMTDLLTEHLAASGALPIADQLEGAWSAAAPPATDAAADATEKAPPAPPKKVTL